MTFSGQYLIGNLIPAKEYDTISGIRKNKTVPENRVYLSATKFIPNLFLYKAT